MPLLRQEDEQFLANLSSDFSASTTNRARLHALIDRLPAGCSALLVVKHEDVVAFEPFGNATCADAVYMAQGVMAHIFRA